MVCIGLGFLVVIPQGHELLEATAYDERLGHKVLFHLSVGCWPFGAWYCSRVLLKRRFKGRFASPSLEADDLFTHGVRIWLPRLLGAVVYAALAAYFLMAGDFVDGVVTLVIGLVYGAWVLYRRAIFPDLPPAAARVDELD